MRKCCFCWDLKVGGIVLGVFSVLFSLASIIYCIWMIVEMEIQNWRGRPVVQNYYQKRLEDEIILYRLISEILLGIGIFVNIAIFISSICLIVGARTVGLMCKSFFQATQKDFKLEMILKIVISFQEKKSRILPYLIFEWLGIIGTALYCFFHGSTAVKEGRSQQGTITIVVGSVYIGWISFHLTKICIKSASIC